MILGRDDAVVTEWLLKADQFKGELKDLAKEIKAQERHERELELVRKSLQSETDKLTESNSKLSEAFSTTWKTITAGNLASTALTTALRTIKDTMDEVTRAGMEWEEDVKSNEAEVTRMQSAMGGLSDALTVAAERERMMKSSLQASEEQLDAVGKAAVIYSRQMNVDVDDALKTITNRLIGGKGLNKLMRELGLEFETTGDRAEDAYRAIDEMQEKFSKINIVAENNKERVRAATAAWNDLKMSLGSITTGLVTDAVEYWSHVLRDIAGYIDRIKNARGYSGARPGTIGGGVDAKTAAENKAAQEAALAGSNKIWRESPWGAGLKHGRITVGGPKYDDEGKPKPKPRAAGGKKLPYGVYWEPEEFPFVSGNIGLGGPGTYFSEQFAGAAAENEALQKFMAIEEALRKARVAEEEFRLEVDLANAPMERQAQILEMGNRVMRATEEQLSAMTFGALTNFTAGLWEAADAALMSGESFGDAMLKMLKSTLFGIAKESTVLALSETAKGFAAQATTWGVPNPASIAHFTSAGIFGSIALTAGGTGLAMSAAGIGRSSSAGGSARNESRNSGRDTSRPSFGTRVQDNRPIYVNVYFGDPTDPGAVLMATKQVQAQLAKAA